MLLQHPAPRSVPDATSRGLNTEIVPSGRAICYFLGTLSAIPGSADYALVDCEYHTGYSLSPGTVQHILCPVDKGPRRVSAARSLGHFPVQGGNFGEYARYQKSLAQYHQIFLGRHPVWHRQTNARYEPV